MEFGKRLSMKCLLYRHEDIISDPITHVNVEHGCISNFRPEEESRDQGMSRARQPASLSKSWTPSSVRNLISKTIIDEEIPLLVSIYPHKYIHIQNTSKDHIDVLLTCWCLYWGVIDIQQTTTVKYKSGESSRVHRSGQLSNTRQWPFASPPTTHQQFPHRLLCPPSIHVSSRCQVPSPAIIGTWTY